MKWGRAGGGVGPGGGNAPTISALEASARGDPAAQALVSARMRHLEAFSEDLHKFARHTRMELLAEVRQRDLLSTPNMVSSVAFDRDNEYFATAGVCRCIKVYEYKSLLRNRVDVHCPVLDISTRSKLACLCWSGYIKSHIASADYDGIVQVWDVNSQAPVMEFSEHSKRVWSVDISRADPTRLVSGSDDGTVKLWSLAQEKSVVTIESRANVCSVQFSPTDANQIAFGCSDYRVLAYDLREASKPLVVMSGHKRAVSFVRYMDAGTLVSASTDNTLKLWDLARGSAAAAGSSGGPASLACERTFTGHTNTKNFVGLAVNDSYIACGSEKNAVYVYCKSLPMPVCSYRFKDRDPITGQVTEDDAGVFVSSLSWRGNSNVVLAANSLGNMKVFELV
eukprot:jgi/Mesvir1/14979/Mv14641-RA.1